MRCKWSGFIFTGLIDKAYAKIELTSSQLSDERYVTLQPVRVASVDKVEEIPLIAHLLIILFAALSLRCWGALRH